MKKTFLPQYLLLAFLLTSSMVMGQLSGSYTINGSSPTSGTNYENFDTAIATLQLNGISGAVTFNVAAGTYSEQVRIPAINGVSANKTITFKGLGASTIIRFLPNNLNSTVVSIDSASHIILDSLSIEATGTKGYGVHFREADTITIRNCTISVPVGSSNSTGGIIASSSITTYTKIARNAQYISLINNTITGGKWGVRIEGMTGPYTIPNKQVNYGRSVIITGNTITNFSEYGINASYMHDVNISGNVCSTIQSVSKGALLLNDVGDNCIIDKNKLYINSNNTNTAVITLAMDPGNGPAGNSTLPVIVSNNFIHYDGTSTSSPSGIILKDKAYLKVYNNTIQVNNQGSTANCIWLDASNTRNLDGIEIANNILSLQNSGSGYFIYNNANGASFKNMDLHHNNFYNLSSYFQVRIPNGLTGSNTYSSLNSYQNNSNGYGNGDLNVNPAFISTTDLHSSSVAMNDSGIVTSYVTLDIDGDLRSVTHPDMGADEYTPAACPPVSSLQSTNVFSTTAEVFWVPNNSNSTDTFRIEYGPTGFIQGTGSMISTTNDTVSLSGLNATTTYDVYVQTDCTISGNGKSAWTGPISFTTSCAIINTYPFTETFDGNSWVSGTGNSNAGYAIDGCWSQLPSSYIFYRWTTRAGATPTSNTGPTTDFSGNGNYIYTESNTGYANVNAYLTSPQIDFSSLNAPQLTFQYHMYGATTGSLLVRVISMSGTDTVFTISGNQGNMWKEATVDLSAYANQTIQLNFIGKRGNGSTGDIAIDEVHLAETPLCAKPTAFTVGTTTPTSVDLTFNSSGIKFVVEYGPTGFTQGAGSYDTVFTSPATISGLLGSTTYDFYIQNDCTDSAYGFSPWVGPITAQTVCGGITATYTNNWDHLANDSTDDCWSFYHGYSTYSSAKAYSPNGSYALQPISFPNIYRYYNHNTSTSMMISPEFSDLDSNTNQLNLYAGTTYGGLNGVPHLIIGSLPHKDSITAFVPLDTIFPTKNAMTQYIVYLNNVPAGHKHIGIKHGNNSNYVYFGIDNLVYEPAPTCFPPTSGSITSVTDSTAIISWNSVGPTTWNIEYGPTGYKQATGAATGFLTGISSTTDTLFNLNSATCYDVYIQSDCGAGDTSTWFGPLNFCTDCGIFTAPYSENFDGNTWTPTNFVYYDSEIDNCWDASPSTQGAGTVFKWVVDNGTTSSFSTGPNGDATPNGTGKYLYTESTYSTGGLAYLTTPFIDFSALTKPTLSFAYHMYGSSMGDLYVSIFDGTTYDTIHVITGSQQTSSSDPWKRAYVNLSNYNSAPAQIVFVAERGGYYSDLAIDEVTVDELPACLPPMSFALNAFNDTVAIFTWSTLTNNTSFIFEYGPQGFTQGTGTKSYPNGTSGTLSGLSGNTSYDVYLADACDSSVWVGPISFTTLTGLDAELLALISPMSGECGDSAYAISVSVKNNGLSAITNLPITVDISGTMSTSVTTTFTGSIGIGATQTVQVGTINNYYGGLIDVTAYTLLTGDQEKSNDTLVTNGIENISVLPLHLPVDTLCPGDTGIFVGVRQTGIAYNWYKNFTDLYAFYQGDTVSAVAGQTLYLDRAAANSSINTCGNTRIPITMGMITDTAVASFTSMVNLNGADVDFDASASNGHIFDWDFGDGSAGSGIIVSHQYQSGGAYTVTLTVTNTVCGTMNTMSIIVYPTITISEEHFERTLKLYPNPSKGQIEISFDLMTKGKVDLSVVNLLGKTVYKEDLEYQIGKFSKILDLSYLPKGVYLVNVKINDKTTTRRIVLQ